MADNPPSQTPSASQPAVLWVAGVSAIGALIVASVAGPALTEIGARYFEREGIAGAVSLSGLGIVIGGLAIVAKMLSGREGVILGMVESLGRLEIDMTELGDSMAKLVEATTKASDSGQLRADYLLELVEIEKKREARREAIQAGTERGTRDSD